MPGYFREKIQELKFIEKVYSVIYFQNYSKKILWGGGEITNTSTAS